MKLKQAKWNCCNNISASQRNDRKTILHTQDVSQPSYPQRSAVLEPTTRSSSSTRSPQMQTNTSVISQVWRTWPWRDSIASMVKGVWLAETVTDPVASAANQRDLTAPTKEKTYLCTHSECLLAMPTFPCMLDKASWPCSTYIDVLVALRTACHRRNIILRLLL